MKPLLNMGLLQKRIVELYNRFLESPWPIPTDPDISKHSILRDAIIDIIEKSKFNEREWKKYGFRVVHGNSADVFKGCFCKEASSTLKKAIVLGSGVFGTVHKSKIPSCVKGIPKDVEWIAIKLETIGDIFYNSQLPENLRTHLTVIQEAARAGLTPVIYDTFICMDETDASTIVKVMEYVDGVRLGDWLPSASKANISKAKQILTSKVDALGKMGILHNDLHNQNIMVVLTPKGAVKDVVIIDSDLATYAKNTEVKRVSDWFSHSVNYQIAYAILEQLIKEKSIVF
jgi:predicted Ser/Thr protein kinase